MPGSLSKFIAVVLLSTLGIVASGSAFADDFPGKGDRFAWSNALPYYNLANKYLEHGRFEEAKTNFEEAIYRYEYDPDFYVNYGVALRKLESYTAAEEAFKKALELRNNDWQSWSNLANAYLKENRLKDTIAAFQKAMKVNPPPPAKEKEAMLKDIADINKILKMQAPPAASKPDQGSGEPGANGNGHKTASTNEAKSTSSRTKAISAKTLPAKNVPSNAIEQASPQVEKQELKKSGWDWVQ